MGNYQLPSRITFYPSYPLYAYASGLLNANGNIEGLSERKIYDLISLNPSNIKSFSNTEDEFVKFNIDGERTSDFFMTLGHNFKDISQSLTLTENDIDVSATQIVNNSIGNACNYNGWSLSTLSETTTKDLKISFDNFGHTKIGSFLWGKKFEFPHNVGLPTLTCFNLTYLTRYGFGGRVQRLHPNVVPLGALFHFLDGLIKELFVVRYKQAPHQDCCTHKKLHLLSPM